MLPDFGQGQNFDTQSVDGTLSIEKSAELDALQEIAAGDALNFLEVRTPEDQFPLIAMATGIGKGRIIHKIIEKSARRNPNVKILVIAGTKLTLVDQTQAALQGYLEDNDESEHDWVDSELDDELNEITEDVSEEKLERSFLYSTVDYKKRKDSKANVHVGTIQTIQSDSGKDNLNPDDYDLVIVDEAHNIGTQKRLEVIKQFKNVVGFTATPFRHTGVLKAPEQYGFTIINSLTLPEAQEREFLPPLIETPVPTDHLIKEIPTNLNGEIDYKKLEKLLKDSPDLRPFIAEKIQEYIVDGENKKKTIIAVNFVWEAEEIAKLLKEKGISVGVAVNQQAAKQIHSEEIPALDAIERYKLPKENPNSLQVLISPYVASEGFDAPLTEVLVWASPTDSSVRYTQFTGRLARRAPGKLYGHVIDFLYQTAQYKWSYNFGQWMKDSVVQLPNGTLFQGSKKQLTIFTQANGPKIDSLNQTSNKIPLDELWSTSADYLEIQEQDYIINQQNLSRDFVGDYPKIYGIAQIVLNEIKGENPDLVVSRRNRTALSTVITDRDLFTLKMKEKGIETSAQFLPLQPDDFSVTYNNLSGIFRGSADTLLPVVGLVLAEMRVENPEAVHRRRNQSAFTDVVTDRELFLQKMIEKGMQMKSDTLSIKVDDFTITNENLGIEFVGGPKKINTVVRQVLDELRDQHPEAITQRTSGGNMLTIILNKDLFIGKMVEAGIQRREVLLPVGETEFPIVLPALYKFFRGHSSALSLKAKEVVEEIRKDHPDKLGRRKNGSHTVEVVTDKDLFFQKMKGKGASLKKKD